MGRNANSPRAGILAEPLWPSIRGTRAIDVVGLGENSLDRVSVVADWPKGGGKQDVLRSELCSGGQMASALLGCARLGLRSRYLGAVGADASEERILAPLQAAGIDLSGVQRIEGASSRSAWILVRAGDGERSVLAQRDPELRLDLDALDRRSIQDAGLLHVDASDPDASYWAAGVAQKAGIPVVLDADRVAESTEALLSRVDFPVVSEAFAREWGGSENLNDGLERLALSGSRLAVVTRGAEGASAAIGSHRIHSPAARVKVVDTTGAGDAFHAGLIWALFQGCSAEPALNAAHGVAGLSCTALGAQGGLPDAKSLGEFLAHPAATAPGQAGSPSDAENTSA
jgi:sulfofructose kinase